MADNIEVLMIGFRKSKAGGHTVTFEIQPDETPQLLQNAPLNSRWAAAFIRIRDDETTEET